MTTTRAEITINRSPSDVWDVVGDPHSIIDWVPGVESCEIVGNHRTAVLRGNELTERFHVDHAERRVTYSILGRVTSHQGSVQVIAKGDDTSVIYAHEMEPAELAPLFQSSSEDALAQLKIYMESGRAQR